MEDIPPVRRSKREQVLIDIIERNGEQGKLPAELFNMIRKHQNGFAIDDSGLGQTDFVEHEIDVQGHHSSRHKTRPVRSPR